jgi:hypothetical protein
MTVQLTWRQYVFVDGLTHRQRPERLLLVRGCEPLPLWRARSVIEHAVYEAPDLLERLRIAFALPRLQHDRRGLSQQLGQCLGPPAPSAFSAPGPCARLLVFERRLPPGLPRLERPEPATAPRSLAEVAASVSLALLDEWGNPVADVRYELVTPDGSQRAGAFDRAGGALESDVQSGAGELSLPELGSGEVKRRAGPPDGWLRDEVSVALRDAQGEPLSELQYQVVFADGSTRSGTLDAQGLGRLAGTPSWPMRVEFSDFDSEDWD